MKTFEYRSVKYHQCTTVNSWHGPWCYYMYYGTKYWDYCPNSCKLTGWFLIISHIIINQSVIQDIFVILCRTFQAQNVHGNVTSAHLLESQDSARDGAQCTIIVVTQIVTRIWELTAQDVPKVLDLKDFELIMLRNILVINYQMTFWQFK